MSKAKFMSAHDVFEWLGQFVNLEQGVKPPSMRPERMQIIAQAAGNPENCAPAIHIAGSKGKGSVTAMVSAILHEAGFRVGRYLSPHITEYRERIMLNDAFFDEQVYRNAGEELRSVAAALSSPASSEYRALVEVSDGAASAPTFFELLTLYFFLCAREAGCNVLAVETGMGGRLDPTNIAQSRAVIITGIELEHTDMLGDTISKIAFEKAGIIKTGFPVILGEQIHEDAKDALSVFYKTAKDKAAPLYYFPENASIDNILAGKNGVSWTLNCKRDGFFSTPLKLSIALCGKVQAENTSLAILAVKKAFPAISAETIGRAISRVRLPARFERICDDPPVIIDGAHTAVSARLCAETWRQMYGTEGLLLFGCAQGKDTEAMARSLIPCFSKVIITTPGTFKVSEPEKVFTVFRNTAAGLGRGADSIEFIADTARAIRAVVIRAQEMNQAILGTGSFYLAAEIRAALYQKKTG